MKKVKATPQSKGGDSGVDQQPLSSFCFKMKTELNPESGTESGVEISRTRLSLQVQVQGSLSSERPGLATHRHMDR